MSERKSSHVEVASSREIILSRIFDYPRELVWEAWIRPEHLVRWWGPNGFTTEMEEMEVKPGGVMKHVMVGPDGTRYPNKSVFKEVVRPERIVYSHAGGKVDGRGVSFLFSWTFAELEGGRTELTLRQTFEDAETRDRIIREYGAVEGGKQTLGRLDEYLRAHEAFVISRDFAAPRDLVFQAWTDPEHLSRWLAPKGFSVRYAHADIRPGGMAHFCMSGPNGMMMWGKAHYQELVRPERLSYIQTFSDEAGGVTRHPMSPGWPLRMLTEVRFEENGAGSRVVLTWTPQDASAEEWATFRQGMAGMSQGWGGSFEQLDQHLSQARNRG